MYICDEQTRGPSVRCPQALVAPRVLLTIPRADSIWFKVVDTSTPKYAIGCDLEAAVNYPASG